MPRDRDRDHDHGTGAQGETVVPRRGMASRACSSIHTHPACRFFLFYTCVALAMDGGALFMRRVGRSRARWQAMRDIGYTQRVSEGDGIATTCFDHYRFRLQ